MRTRTFTHFLVLATATLLGAADAPSDAAGTPPPPPGVPPDQLRPVVVQGQRYKDPFPTAPRAGFRPTPKFELPVFSYEASPYIVTAARTPQKPENVAQTARLFLADALRATPAMTVDAALRSVPGFSLFRRSDSFSANPTAQGVSLRGLGPSGASRSLLLHDGVPLNDPFGGWVTWSKIPRDGLARVEIVPGGGATAWGNASLGGVVQLFTRKADGVYTLVRRPPPPGSPPHTEGDLTWGTLATAFARVDIGDYGTRSVELSTAYPVERGTLQLLGRVFATDGFHLVAPERRGSIDIPAWSRHRWLTGRWRQPLGPDAEVLVTARTFEEKRGNGTPYQQNESRESFASVAFAGQIENDLIWNAVAYVQSQAFASTFSSVNATRTAETPASDQHDVPATSFGAAWSATWKHGTSKASLNAPRTIAGLDTRLVRGETREYFSYAAGAFTRERVAGGQQSVTGAYVLHERPLSETWRASVGARVDAARDTDGHRRETDRATGAYFRDDHYADRDSVFFSPSAGVVWTPTATWRLRASAQRSFRRPTLNELYRPFRVGPNVTEANAALGTERATSGEAGGEWTLFASSQPPAPPPQSPARGSLAQPRPPPPPVWRAVLTLGAMAFVNDLRDAVGNVTLVRGPGTFPLFGTIAAGGVGRQRLNLERTRVQGLELSARWYPTKTLTVTGDYLYNDATVRRTALAPGLVGKRVAQVPRDSAALGAHWRAPRGFTVTPRLRWIGKQFEDDENQLTLGEVVVADLGIGYSLNKHLELFLMAENLGNARIETGRSADGVVNTGTPRLFVGGLRGNW